MRQPASEEGNNTKSIEVGGITVVFYQPDVELCISWSTEIVGGSCRIMG